MTALERASRLFHQRFGAPPELCATAPGRVNLIGEHTDYNDGFVLPCAIDYRTAVCASPRDDLRVHAVAADFGGQASELRLDCPIVRDERAPWSDYLRGVLEVLMALGHAPTGVDLVVAGDVPQGAGLSSSAALEVAVALAIARLWKLPLDGRQLAQVGQRAENDFVGCRCGIMDQLVSALGQPDHALLIDCRSLETRPVPLPAGSALVIVDSKVQRGLVESQYNQRRARCEQAARHFGVAALRDVDEERLAGHGRGLDEVTLRRARHVVCENARTLAAAEALEAGDLVRLGRLMADSHRSMRDDFEITVPAIDALVDIISEVLAGQGGVRMTGGGFGGCVVALAPADAVDEIRAVVARRYPRGTGLIAELHLCRASAGAVEESLRGHLV